MMTDAADHLVAAFDALSPSHRQEVAAALLRRVLDEVPSDVSEDALVTVAENLFLELDAAESDDGEPQTR